MPVFSHPQARRAGKPGGQDGPGRELAGLALGGLGCELAELGATRVGHRLRGWRKRRCRWDRWFGWHPGVWENSILGDSRARFPRRLPNARPSQAIFYAMPFRLWCLLHRALHFQPDSRHAGRQAGGRQVRSTGRRQSLPHFWQPGATGILRRLTAFRGNVWD